MSYKKQRRRENEEGIIEIVKYKELNEIKEIFKNNNMKIKQLNYLINIV